MQDSAIEFKFLYPSTPLPPRKPSVLFPTECKLQPAFPTKSILTLLHPSTICHPVHQRHFGRCRGIQVGLLSTSHLRKCSVAHTGRKQGEQTSGDPILKSKKHHCTPIKCKRMIFNYQHPTSKHLGIHTCHSPGIQDTSLGAESSACSATSRVGSEAT